MSYRSHPEPADYSWGVAVILTTFSGRAAKILYHFIKAAFGPVKFPSGNGTESELQARFELEGKAVA